MHYVFDLGLNAMGFEEPNAVYKWTDGSDFFVWSSEQDWEYILLGNLPEESEDIEDEAIAITLGESEEQTMRLDIFEQYDLDNSGSLNRDEALALLKDINTAAREYEEEWSWYYEEDP